MKMIARPLAGFLSAVAGSVLVVAVFHFTLWGKDAPPNIKVSSTPLVRDVKLGTSFAPVVKKAAPSVVNIYSTRTVQEQPMRNPFRNNPLFRQYFGDQFPGDDQPRSRKEQGLGSGVIISPDGYILTANHVVSGADELKVTLAADDKKEYTARVIGTDPQTDVAVLKIDATGLPAVTLADSDQLEIGDVVLAIGNPFGVGTTVTSGIVSAMSTSRIGIPGDEDYIQTDAAINPGNSGGPLLNASGQLIGINTAIISPSGGSSGIGFALPSNVARRIMTQLIEKGHVIRGFLGVGLQPMSPPLAEALNLTRPAGAIITDVAPDSPAAKAGLQKGDVVLGMNGRTIRDFDRLRLYIAEAQPGANVQLAISREGKEQTLHVTLTERPNPPAPSEKAATGDVLAGAAIAELTEQTRQELGLDPNVNGILIMAVDPEGDSAEAGLKSGDVIVFANRQAVPDVAGLRKALSETKLALLEINRHGSTFFFAVPRA
jgi:serine protease Do